MGVVLICGGTGVGEGTVGSASCLGGGVRVGSEVEGGAVVRVTPGGGPVSAGRTRTVAVVESEDPAESVTVPLSREQDVLFMIYFLVT